MSSLCQFCSYSILIQSSKWIKNVFFFFKYCLTKMTATLNITDMTTP